LDSMTNSETIKQRKVQGSFLSEDHERASRSSRGKIVGRTEDVEIYFLRKECAAFVACIVRCTDSTISLSTE
jgi:hypothetical protein